MTEKKKDDAAAGIAKAISPNNRRAHQKAIGQGLRDYFNSVVSEPIPDEFLSLLKKMDEEIKGGPE